MGTNTMVAVMSVESYISRNIHGVVYKNYTNAGSAEAKKFWEKILNKVNKSIDCLIEVQDLYRKGI